MLTLTLLPKNGGENAEFEVIHSAKLVNNMIMTMIKSTHKIMPFA
jgi:hypothetical protein